MKSFITLLIAAFMLAGAAQAQTTEDARRVILGQKKKDSKSGDNEGVFGTRNDRRVDEDRRYSGTRQAETDRVNREYDYKVQTIRNNGALSSEEKDRIIRDLNRQRDREIKRINNSYKDRSYRNNDDDDDDDRKYKKDRKYKSNNGKHKGWKKGKGNKHRDRDDD